MASNYVIALSDTLASAGKDGGDNDNLSGRTSAIVVIDITAVASGTLTFTLQGKDPASGKYYTILASAALGAVATTILRVNPDLTAAGNTIAKDFMPVMWRVIAAENSIVGATYTVGVHLVG